MRLEIPGAECTHGGAYLALGGAGNGVGMWCADCEQWATKALGYHTSWALPKSHRLLTNILRDALPRVTFGDAETCAICLNKTVEAEMHHWWPKALQEGHELPNEGPQDWLCKSCHLAWHNVVTPGLVGGMTREGAMVMLRRWYKRFSPHEWRTFVNSVNEADAGVRKRRQPPTPLPPNSEGAA